MPELDFEAFESRVKHYILSLFHLTRGQDLQRSLRLTTAYKPRNFL